jgi:GMP synthase PP-ATPase subunit
MSPHDRGLYQLDTKFLGETATRIINERRHRVVDDVTSKSPGMIEWE